MVIGRASVAWEGPACVAAAFAIPAVLAAGVSATTEHQNAPTLMFIAAVIMAIAALLGSATIAGGAIVLSGASAMVAGAPVPMLAVLGLGLFASLMFVDLAGSLRRSPTVSSRVWGIAATSFAAVAVCATVAFVAAYFFATLTTWQTIVIPFGVAAVGFGFKLAVDAHASNVKASRNKRI